MIQTLFSTHKLYFRLGLVIVFALLLSAIGVQQLRVNSLKSENKVISLELSLSKEKIVQLETQQKELIKVNSDLRKKQQVSIQQKLKNQKQLQTKLKELGMTKVFQEKLYCLELASGKKPEQYSEFCPQFFDKKN